MSSFNLQLEKINENKSMSEIFWRRTRTQIRKMDFRRKSELRKRVDTRTEDYKCCVTDEQLKGFDGIEW
jgi:hypothetical protein